MKTLKFSDITFGYDKQKPIFQNLSFEIRNPTPDKGYITALMGASGSGKSTLLKLILGTQKVNTGTITSNPEQPVIAYLPQEPVLFEHLSPLQNARYFATITFYKKRFEETIFNELVQSLNMKEVLESTKTVSELSGGQRQRLSLLRALSIKPDFLLLDEPTTGLDADVKIQFLTKLRELVAKFNLLVVYVTHHKLETELVVDEIIYLAQNKKTGVIDKVFQDTILNFIKTPPLLEALKVFKYPKPNLIYITEKNNKIHLENEKYTNGCIVNVENKHIQFVSNEKDGFKFNILTSNNIYTLIELANTQTLISLNIEIPNPDKYKIVFTGNVSCYDTEGYFLKYLDINQNSIIN